MLEELQKTLDNFKQKFNRCTETIGNITYKKLNYDNCTKSIKNKNWLEHASLFENERIQ